MQDGKATGDSPLNVRPHAEVSVNENTKVTHRLGLLDVSLGKFIISTLLLFDLLLHAQSVAELN